MTAEAHIWNLYMLDSDQLKLTATNKHYFHLITILIHPRETTSDCGSEETRGTRLSEKRDLLLKVTSSLEECNPLSDDLIDHRDESPG